ncbi:MAG: beta-ketoacyl synthase N-terminal-like domain-containing protein, partial [Deltaproteobacteria bacterium]
MKRRVVISGMGVISSIGLNPDEFWKSCLEAKTKVEPIPEHWFHYGDF